MIIKTQIVECPTCLHEQEHDFLFKYAETTQDIMDVDVRTEKDECEFCGQIFSAEWTGWNIHGDAG